MVAFFIKLIPFHRSLPVDSLLATSVAPNSLPWREAVSLSWLVLGPDLLLEVDEATLSFQGGPRALVHP